MLGNCSYVTEITVLSRKEEVLSRKSSYLGDYIGIRVGIIPSEQWESAGITGFNDEDGPPTGAIP